jgi:imidazolonepropionase-like amidohydrolase
MGRTLFANANLIDGTNPPQVGMTVAVEGSRIVAVGPAQATRPEPGDQVFDLAGASLMPGMFQCHMHAAMDDTQSFIELDMKYPPNYLTLVAARNLNRMLRLGFTSMVGAGSPANIDVVLKHAINGGLFPGPRVFACGHHISTTGESLDFHPSFWKSDLQGFGLVADGPDEFRKAVRQEIKDGADIVKVHTTGGHGSNYPARFLTVSNDELQAATDAAHERGKKIRTHTVGKAGILAAARMGVDLIDHVDHLDDECIEAFLKHGTTVTIGAHVMLKLIGFLEASATQPRRRDPMASPFFSAVDRSDPNAPYEAMEHYREFVPRAVKAGVNIVLGDDTGGGIVPHGAYADELVTCVEELGVPADDVIRWATGNAGRFIADGDLGVIAEGRLADLVVAAGDPTRNIRLLQDPKNLRAIMKDGVFVKQALGAGQGDDRPGGVDANSDFSVLQFATGV